jgi:UDP-N-acetylglucosamine 2-epimerase (non-hydrolysing)
VKILTVVGTRPEIIRLSQVIPLLDRHAEHVLIHTGQNFSESLSSIFFRELGLRNPDVYLGVRGQSFADQIAQIVAGCAAEFVRHRPDRVLVLGDTDSGLCALMARRLGIPVFHLEAGNRCFDDRVPEEVNRRVIDQCSTVLMPYTHRSRENLIREGISGDRIYVVGNPIKEVMDRHRPSIDASLVLRELGLSERGFFLVTMHRAENVDVEDRLRSLCEGLKEIVRVYGKPAICSIHPRTRLRLDTAGLGEMEGVRFLEPLGFFDFVRLEHAAFCILTDSGTVQEEASILRVPAVTLRDVTERPETIDCGSNVLAGCEPASIVRSVGLVTSLPAAWQPPPEYLIDNVSAAVGRVVLGFRPADAAEQLWRDRRRSFGIADPVACD